MNYINESENMVKNDFFRGIPPYEGGNVIIDMNSGAGFYDDRTPLDSYDTLFRVGDEYTEEELREKILELKRPNRAHFETCFQGLAGRLTVDTRLIHFTWNEGKITSVKYLDPSPEEVEDLSSRLLVIKETSAQEFLAYIEKLVGGGFTVSYENKAENNLFREMTDGNRRLYLYYMANTETVRIIEDRIGESISSFGYSCAPLEGEKCEIYQYGHHYDVMSRGFTCDCGMLYIIKLADNSVFLVDGGKYEQASDRVVADVMELLRKITKTPEGEKIRIACYFITHAHDDHLDLVSKLIKVYHDELTLERIMFNYPCRDRFALSPENYIMMERVKKYYPSVKYLKPHSGHRFRLADTEFEVIQAHEDVWGEVDLNVFKSLNDTSTVIRVGIGEGKTFTLLADIGRDGERIMLGHYSEKYLKSDVVQVAHHLINLLDYLYDAMSPTVALIPQHSERRYRENNKKLDAVRRSVREENIYFAHDGTVGFRVENGEICRCCKDEPLGVTCYDGSES